MLYICLRTSRLKDPSHKRRILPRVRPAALASVAVALVLFAGGAARGQSAPETPLAGLATWVDIYDGVVYANPELTAGRIAARGVRTVFAETANDRSPVDVVKPAPLGRLVDALHARGIEVVAWYLPGFVDPVRDLRRTRAMLSFRTPSGGAFDAVALDIESTRNRNAGQRSRRMLALSRTLRTEAASLPVYAITLPPRMLERRPTAWPGFPWAELAGLVDGFVPMAYTGSAFRGYEATYGYVARSLALLRTATANPELAIHAAGGVANRMSVEELRGFADAVADDGGVVGWSYYDFATSTPAAWTSLAPLGGRASP
jgi:hypothetical protein